MNDKEQLYYVIEGVQTVPMSNGDTHLAILTLCKNGRPLQQFGYGMNTGYAPQC